MQPRCPYPPTHILNQLLAQLRPDPPDVPGIDFVDALPSAGVVERLGTDQLLAQLQPLRRRPRGRVHAIGDRADRDLRGIEGRPEAVEHRPAHLAVQQRYAVGTLGQSQSHVGHVEGGGIILRAQRDDAIHWHAGQQGGISGFPEVPAHQVHGESVDARRNRCVRGEYGTGSHHGQGRFDIEPLLFDVFPDALQPQESRMPFVGVEHLGRR
ncbi:Uncharacterised protein [Mycobacteroides abscessus subsp. massiliense]|nr:Uncharacterised protein [Mycobacteroides abscessus subsp. massiliense]